jgi:hypothetical protein
MKLHTREQAPKEGQAEAPKPMSAVRSVGAVLRQAHAAAALLVEALAACFL